MKHAVVALLLSGALTAVAGGPALAAGQAGGADEFRGNRPTDATEVDASTDRPVALGGKLDPGGYGDFVPTVLGGRNLPGGYGDYVPTVLGGKSDPGGYGGSVPTVLGGRNLPGGYGD